MTSLRLLLLLCSLKYQKILCILSHYQSEMGKEGSENIWILKAKTTIHIYRACAMRKSVFGHKRQQMPRSVCTSAQSDQGLHCPLTESLDTTECINGDLGHVQDDVNLHILCMPEGTFSLDEANTVRLELYNWPYSETCVREPPLSGGVEKVVCLIKVHVM